MRALRAVAIFLFLTSMIAAASDIDRVVVYKKAHRLELQSRGNVVRQYKIALGAEPVGPKQRQGDHRTPEGVYTLDFRNERSQFYKAYHVSYPNADDRARAKKLGVAPGGDIMLHGLPKAYTWVGKSHSLHDWTDGCIAVSNEEMDEIWSLVKVGTTIEIKP